MNRRQNIHNGINALEDHSAKGAVRTKIFLSAILVLITVLGFNALFNFTTLEKLHTESAAVKYQVLGESLRQTIKQSLLSGQRIQDLQGINDTLTLTKKRIERLFIETDTGLEKVVAPISDFNTIVSICLPNGQFLYSTEKAQLHTQVAVSLKDPNTIKKERRSYLGRSVVTRQNGLQFLQLPVRGAQKKWVATQCCHP